MKRELHKIQHECTVKPNFTFYNPIKIQILDDPWVQFKFRHGTFIWRGGEAFASARRAALQKNCQPLFGKVALFPHYMANDDAAILGSANKEQDNRWCRVTCQL